VSNEKRNWKQFQKLSFDSGNFSKRYKKAEGATMRHARKFLVTRLDNVRSVRRHIIGWLLFVAVMIIAVGIQFMWFRGGYETLAAAHGGTYAEASLGPIGTLDPLYATTSAEMAASKLMFSSLYNYDSTGTLQGDLAKSIAIGEEDSEYTVKIRDDVKWHDGANLTAKDVEFTVNLIKDPETRSPLRINWRDVDVVAIDDETVKFTLPATYAAFPNALTFPVLPEHILRDVAPGTLRENQFSRQPIGSGPFKHQLTQTSSRDSNARIVQTAAFEDYYGGAPMLSRFEIHAYDSQESIVRALRSGEVSAAADMSGVDPSQIDEYSYDIKNKPINNGVYAMFNTEAAPMSDVDVRRALRLATDTSAIRASQPAETKPLHLPFVESQIDGNLPAAPKTDVEAAKKALDKAGWRMRDGARQKDGEKLAITIATTKNSQYEKALEALASQWRELGITINTNIVNTADPSANFVQNVLQPRSYDVLLYELAIGADPDVYAYWHSSQIGLDGYNFSNYSNASADDALSSARSRVEPALRNAKYQQFARQWLEDAPAIGLYQANFTYVANKEAETLRDDLELVAGPDRFTDVNKWSVETKPVYKTP